MTADAFVAFVFAPGVVLLLGYTSYRVFIWNLDREDRAEERRKLEEASVRHLG